MINTKLEYSAELMGVAKWSRDIINIIIIVFKFIDLKVCVCGVCMFIYDYTR